MSKVEQINLDVRPASEASPPRGKILKWHMYITLTNADMLPSVGKFINHLPYTYVGPPSPLPCSIFAEDKVLHCTKHTMGQTNYRKSLSSLTVKL